MYLLVLANRDNTFYSYSRHCTRTIKYYEYHTMYVLRIQPYYVYVIITQFDLFGTLLTSTLSMIKFGTSGLLLA